MLTRKQLRQLISEALKQSVNYQNEKISITDEGTVMIRGKEYKLSVLQKKFGVEIGFIPISITKIESIKDKLMITGGALGQYETSELKNDSVNKITRAIKGGKSEFVIAPPEGEEGNTIKFQLKT